VRSGSPDATDFDTLIGQRAVVYLGLDSLSDPMVGAALGRLLLADLASLAGDLHHRPGPRVPIACYIDEAAECLAEPAVALLNKGRSAGFAMTVLTQTVADFVAATGSEARARQVLGNTNNLFCLRVRDVMARDYVAGLMPDTLLYSVTQGVGTGATPASLLGHSLQDNAQCQAQALPLVDPMLLGALPDLECFAQFAGGAVHKIAIPLLAFDPGPCCGR
jgi:conjugal transfer pilus assembly protein TraD